MDKGPGNAIKRYALLAAVLSLVLVLLFAWWFGLVILPLATYVILALLATLSVPIIYRVAGFKREDEIEWIEQREEREHRDLIARLATAETELSKLGIDDGKRQAQQLTALVNDYHSVVETRFMGKKHMPLEYLGAARQVQKQAVQNLSDVVTLGHSLATIDSNSFESTDGQGQQDRAERNSDMAREQGQRIRGLLDENRQMFDALTETAVEVANIPSFSKYERIDTLARLVSLAEIANNSSR